MSMGLEMPELEMMGEAAEETNLPVEKVITNVATKTMSGGGFASIMGWMASSEGIAIFGLAVALLGFGVNLVFRIRKDRREQKIHEAELALLEQQYSESLRPA